jgi:hypothetical protein
VRVLLVYLRKAQLAIDQGILEESEIVGARLVADMFSFAQQVQLACDNAKNGSARLAGRKPPRFDDTEQTIAELRRRVESTMAYVRTFRPADFQGSEERLIDQSFRQANYNLPGGDYLRAVLLPNFYFHISMAHGILRHLGVQIGKGDFLGVMPRVATGGTMDVRPPVEFLTSAESSEWIVRRGMREDPDDSLAELSCFQFALEPLDVSLIELIEALIEDMGSFQGGLLRVTDWIWDDEYDVDPTEAIRQAQHESRSLSEVPGFLFTAENAKEATSLLVLIVERRWTGRFYSTTGPTILQFCGGHRVDVYTADRDAEQRMRYRLVESGAVLSLP